MKSEFQRPEPSKLLEAFLASDRSERAFAALVGSLNRLVHSAALRRTGQIQLAEEVSQNVFAILARKASSLRNHPCLEAWAMETTRLEARTVLRSERRRQSKIAALTQETEALSSNPAETMHSSNHWQEALPILDDALARLPMKDRRLIIERFYQEKKFSEIAAATGQTEGACKKRLKRTLDKLSGLLTARGVTLSVTVIASALGSELARSAPSQAAALMAPKALAAASSVTTTTLLTNTVFTMSTIKTSTLTVAVVIALAAIPFSQQLAEARRMEAEIVKSNPGVGEETPALTRSSRSASRMTVGTSSARTPSRLLASLSAAKTSREILRDLCSFDGMTSELARQRVARMSNEERAELLAEVWRFPCGFYTRDGLLSFIVGSNGDAPPDMMLDQIIAGGHYQAFTAGSTLDDNLLTRWAKKDPAAAVQWFEKKLASDDLMGGLGDQSFKDLYLHLMSGLVASDPDRALEIYAGTASDIRDARYGMFWPTIGLGDVFAKQMAERGDDSGMRKLLELSKGPARELFVSSAAQAYANVGKLNEALAFVDQNKQEPWKPSDFPGVDYGNNSYDRDEYVRSIADGSRRAAGLDTSLDWLVANISKPEKATMTVMRMMYRYDEFGQQDQAMRWLNRQPSGPVRDAAHASIVWQQTMGSKYDDAMQGTSKIEDPSVRSQMVKIVEDSRQLYKDTGGQRRVFQTSDTPKIKF